MHGKKALIVEDDTMLCTIFDMFVKEIGMEITSTVNTGEKAIKSCKKNLPDIILMDIHLEGDMDGIETSRYICENFFIPVIYISGDTNIDTVKEATLKNTYGFLTKPITREKLEITIKFALSKHELLYGSLTNNQI